MHQSEATLAPTSAPTTPRTPSQRKREQKREESVVFNSFSWPALIAECQALQSRLERDLEFRRDLLRYIAVCVVNCSASEGDFGAPQRVCFLWRQAHRVVLWKNCTTLTQQLLSYWQNSNAHMSCGTDSGMNKEWTELQCGKQMFTCSIINFHFVPWWIAYCFWLIKGNWCHFLDSIRWFVRKIKKVVSNRAWFGLRWTSGGSSLNNLRTNKFHSKRKCTRARILKT